MSARGLLLLLALARAAPAAAWADAPPRMLPPTAETVQPLGPCGPIGRAYEPIELPAIRLRRLGMPPIERLGLLAIRDGSARPIPFQVDERGGHKVALPGGREPTAADKPGVFDGDDQLVFMACDAGEATTPESRAALLAGAGTVSAWREIRIADPIEGTTAYVYLLVSDHPPLSERRYVEYDSAHDIVHSARYRIGMVNALPNYFAVALAEPLGPNLIDGARLRAEATLRAGLAHWTLDERGGSHELVAWKAGPVRVIRRSRHRVHVAGLYLTAGLAHTYFYSQHVFGPGSLRLPFSPSLMFRDITAEGGVDFRSLRGWRYRAPGTPPDGFHIDGHMDAAEQAFRARGLWFLLQHGAEAILVDTTPSPNLVEQIPLELVYIDDASRVAPPEEVPGSVPFVGYRGRDVQRLTKGRYTFQIRVFGLTHYRPGDEQRLLRQIETPLTAEVSDRSGPEAAP